MGETDLTKNVAEHGNMIRDLADVDVSGMLDGGRTTVTGTLTGLAFSVSAAAKFLDETAAAAPLGITSTVLGAVAKAVNGGCVAHDAQKAMATMKLLRGSAEGLPESADKKTLLEAIDYCIGKTRMKFRKGFGNATVIGQPITTLFRGGKAIIKKIKHTKGVHRREYAEKLMAIAGRPTDAGRIAQIVIETILKQSFKEIATKALEEGLKSG